MNNVCQFCNVEHTVAVPTVHLNGTNAQDLFDQFQAAADAMRAARRAVVAGAPNGRDYYPQGDGPMRNAMFQHERRCQELTRMLAELEESRDHVQAVLDFKAQQRASRLEAR